MLFHIWLKTVETTNRPRKSIQSGRRLTKKYTQYDDWYFVACAMWVNGFHKRKQFQIMYFFILQTEIVSFYPTKLYATFDKPKAQQWIEKI